MIVVGFVSCYREGRLVRGAIDSILEVELDRLYIFEGPAGEPLANEEELPPSDVERYGPAARFGAAPVTLHRRRLATAH